MTGGTSILNGGGDLASNGGGVESGTDADAEDVAMEFAGAGEGSETEAAGDIGTEGGSTDAADEEASIAIAQALGGGGAKGGRRSRGGAHGRGGRTARGSYGDDSSSVGDANTVEDEETAHGDDASFEALHAARQIAVSATKLAVNDGAVEPVKADQDESAGDEDADANLATVSNEGGETETSNTKGVVSVVKNSRGSKMPYYAGFHPDLPTCDALKGRISYHPEHENEEDQFARAVPLKVVGRVRIMNFTDQFNYAHMVTATVAKGFIFAAWQAAPKVVDSGAQRMAIEGLADQVILYSTSLNGIAWSPPLTAQLNQKGAVWSPVLHATKDGNVLLFYTESHACFRPTNPKTYMPGGSIKMAKLVIKTGKSVVPMRAEWETPVMLREQQETQMPWVIANKMLVASNGNWVLPYWQEYTFHFHVEMQARNDKFTDGIQRERPEHCDPVKMFSKENSDRLKMLQEAGERAGESDDDNDVRETISGVLVSEDQGKTWNEFGRIVHPRSHVLEGAVVEVPVKDGSAASSEEGDAAAGTKTQLLMMFRSSCGCLMKATSSDFGRTWNPLQHTILPNPNSKIDMLRLRSGHIVLGFNNHKQRSKQMAMEGCRMCRTHLHLAVSDDHGTTFSWVATLDDTEELNYRVHYPTLLEVNDKLLIFYTKFYVGKCVVPPGMEDSTVGRPLRWPRFVRKPGSIFKEPKGPCPGVGYADQGVRLAFVDLKPMKQGRLPQVSAKPSHTNHEPDPNQGQLLKKMLEHWVSSGFAGVKDAVINRRDMTPEEKFFFQNAGTMIHASGKRSNAAFAAWDRLCGIMARNYDLTAVGGRSYMRKRRDLLKWVADHLHEQYTQYGEKLGSMAGSSGAIDLAASLGDGD